MRKSTIALWLCLLMTTMPLVGFTYDNDTLGTSIDSSSGARDVDGCTNSFAVNYNPEATNDDGSCRYEPYLFTPNGGEEWDVDTTQEITWNATGWSTVSLYYSNDQGATWIYIDTIDNSGAYDWLVPDAPNTRAMVRIAVSGTTGNGSNQTWDDTNDGIFTINNAPTNGTIGDCAKLVIVANGHVGPVWSTPGAAGPPYGIDDIVEWPAGSGQFWRSDSLNNYGEPGVGANWWGPCTCEDIWNYTQTVWDSSTNYSLYEVVSYNGALYYSLTNSNQGQNPDSPSDPDTPHWTLCFNGTDKDCRTGYNGYGGPVWSPGTSIFIGDIFEYPANSGEFYIAINNAQGPNIDAPDGSIHNNSIEFWEGVCNCTEIWMDSGVQAVWNAAQSYNPWYIVEWPASSGELWIATPGGYGAEPGNPDYNNWTRCGGGGDPPSTGPCSEFKGFGGPVWVSGSVANIGDIFEHPAGSGEFYMLVNGGGTVMPDPGPGDVWSDACNCTEIWQDNNQPMWDSALATTSSSNPYDTWYIVGYGQSPTLYISEMDDNPMQPDATRWHGCGDETTGGGPCSLFNGFGGPAWVSGSVANIGDIFEHPAGSGEFYMLVNGGGGVMPDPGYGDEWSEACNCTEIWQGNNQPMWDSALATTSSSNPYDAWYIVGYGQSPTLYISEMNDNPMQPDATRWHVCGPMACADVSGPWPHWVNPQWTGVGYSVGDQVSFGNGLYISTMNNNMVWPNVPDKRAWIECNCSDLDSTSWNIQSTYGSGDVVVDNDGDYWIALLPHSGVLPTPFVTHDLNGNEALFWRPCDYCDLSDSHIDGLWNQNIAGIGGYAYGDIREHGGSYYIAIIDGTQQEPGTDTWWFYWQWGTNTIKLQLPLMSQGWVECNCTEIANGNVYDSAHVYDEGDVVIGPDGEVWISMYNNNQWWPGIIFIITPWGWGGGSAADTPFKIVIPTWRRCEPTGGCGEDIPVWNPATGASSAYVVGDTVEWPAGTGNDWQLQVTGSNDVPAFNTDWRHCTMLPTDWPDHSKALPPNSGQVILQEPQNMAKCDARAAEASGLPALEAEDADYLCSAELSIVFSEEGNDSATSDTDGRDITYQYCHDGCCGIRSSDRLTAHLSYYTECTGMAPPGGSGLEWDFDELEDGTTRATTVLSGVTCDSPILEDVIAGHTCTDNIALQLKKEWTAVSEATLSLALTYGYPMVDDCRLITDQPDMLCGSMTNLNSSMMIGDEEHRVIFLDPGGTSIIGYYSGDPIPTAISCKCGTTTWCNAPYVCVEPSCDCVLPKDAEGDIRFDGSDMVIRLVSSVYDSMVRAAEQEDEIAAPNPEERDDDEDGVHNAWDTCPDTVNGTATDSAGCEVKAKAAAEDGGGMPGFSIMLTISALLGAIVYTNRWRRMD